MSEYEDEVIFLAVIREDGAGDPATVEYAGWYANNYRLNFPSVPDVGGHWGAFMGDGYPTNLIIDLPTMQLKYTLSGLMTDSDIRTRLARYLNE